MAQEQSFLDERRFLFAFVLFLFALAAARFALGEAATTDIKLDQVGYLPAAPKIAFISHAGANAGNFLVKRTSDNRVAFEGKLGVTVHDPNTGDDIQAADFSMLQSPGRYYIDVPEVGRSWNFSIAPNVYSRAYQLAMLGFYGQRCGTKVDLGTEFPEYTHAACHLKGNFHPTSGRSGERDNAGGWHDAGDYGRYVVNSGISTGSLLWAWELYAANLKNIPLRIPESGNGTPDILSEARWNLEWMLTMQDDDGGVCWRREQKT